MIPELETERLRLRPWRESDLDAFAAFCADVDLVQYMGGPCGRDDAWRRIALFLGHWHIRGFGNWVIEEKSGGGFAGYAGLWQPSGWPERELMWGLARPFHGRGIATEAAARARDFAFGPLGWRTLVSYILPANSRSRAVAERLGARLDGTSLLRATPVDVWRHPMPT